MWDCMPDQKTEVNVCEIVSVYKEKSNALMGEVWNVRSVVDGVLCLYINALSPREAQFP